MEHKEKASSFLCSQNGITNSLFPLLSSPFIGPQVSSSIPALPHFKPLFSSNGELRAFSWASFYHWTIIPSSFEPDWYQIYLSPNITLPFPSCDTSHVGPIVEDVKALMTRIWSFSYSYVSPTLWDCSLLSLYYPLQQFTLFMVWGTTRPHCWSSSWRVYWFVWLMFSAFCCIAFVYWLVLLRNEIIYPFNWKNKNKINKD